MSDREEMRALFAHLCSLASSGAAIASELAGQSDDSARCCDLANALGALFGPVGYIGEMGARSCSDPGLHTNPAQWLVGPVVCRALVRAV